MTEDSNIRMGVGITSQHTTYRLTAGGCNESGVIGVSPQESRVVTRWATLEMGLPQSPVDALLPDHNIGKIAHAAPGYAAAA
jgi:hypothetical protein